MLRVLKNMQYYVAIFGLILVVGIPFLLEEKEENNQKYLAPSEQYIDRELDSVINALEERSSEVQTPHQ